MKKQSNFLKNNKFKIILIMVWYSTIAWGPGSMNYIMLPLGPFLASWSLTNNKVANKWNRIGLSLVASYTTSFLALIFQTIFHSGADWGLLCSITWYTIPMLVLIQVFALWKKIQIEPIFKIFIFLSFATILATLLEKFASMEISSAAKLAVDLNNSDIMDWRSSIFSRLFFFPIANAIFWGTALYYSKEQEK